MRVDRFQPKFAVSDPMLLGGGLQSTFTSGHLGKSVEDYDIYFVNGTTYVCREGCVAVFSDAGTCYIRGADGKRVSGELANKYPRPGSITKK